MSALFSARSCAIVDGDNQLRGLPDAVGAALTNADIHDNPVDRKGACAEIFHNLTIE